ncbi:MAG: serine O-acetyltransferase [Candidatus Lokiarchaeota archaeon]|nr:serine O-acetyltransferase [Candidatus Lokiarchaeota archaeon]
MEDFLSCLSCGKKLGAKSKNNHGQCTECLLKLEFKTEDTDFEFIQKYLQGILDFFVSDVSAAFNKDPAARTLIEVLTSYPGIKAVLLYRISHFFWKLNVPYIPRYISDIARELTAIDIHPGAEIGSEFFIDHGVGVVIGETAEVGNNVTFYAGVVLGGTNLEQIKRHPTLGDNIVVGTGAKILGPITIGNNVRVGANSVVVNDVPPNCVVVGVPGKIVSKKGDKIDKIDLRHGDLPDPISIAISRLDKRLKEIENQFPNIKKPSKDELEIFYGEYGEGI